MIKAFISDFKSIDPPVLVSHKQSNAWLVRQHAKQANKDELDKLEKRFRYYGVSENKIGFRRLASKDMAHDIENRFQMFSQSDFQDIDKKSKFYSQYAFDIFKEFYPSAEKLPDHIIHTTCTGYISPSAPQRIVSKYRSNTKVTHAYHMGCYAAFSSIRIANALVKSEEDLNVEVAHTETCSIHMNPMDHSPEQLVIQTLFADGNIKYKIQNNVSSGKCYEIVAIEETIVPETVEDMCWEIKKWGFSMSLSRDVPKKISSYLNHALEKLASKIEIPLSELMEKAIFAIHPGGPKIIEGVETSLKLRPEQSKYSKEVLYERGNMSSATLPHVWKKILESNPKKDDLVVSLAFGPGLTIFSSLFIYRSLN